MPHSHHRAPLENRLFQGRLAKLAWTDVLSDGSGETRGVPFQSLHDIRLVKRDPPDLPFASLGGALASDWKLELDSTFTGVLSPPKKRTVAEPPSRRYETNCIRD